MPRKDGAKKQEELEFHFFNAIENWLLYQDNVKAMTELDGFDAICRKKFNTETEEITEYFKEVILENRSKRRFVGKLQQFSFDKNPVMLDLKHSLLGFLYKNLADYPMAVKAFEKVLSGENLVFDCKIINGLAFSEMQLENNEKAEKLLKSQKSIKTREDKLSCLRLLGEVLMKQGKIIEAEEVWEDALDLDPNPYTREYIRARLLDVSADFPIRQSGIIKYDAKPIFSRNINHLVSRLIASRVVSSKNRNMLEKEAKEVIDECNNEMKSSWFSERFSPVLVSDIKRQNDDFARNIHLGRLLEELISRRRQYLTCVKISMQGFTAHFKYLDDQLKLINDFQKRIANIIFRNNGAVDRVQTTNIMAYFGFMYEGNDLGVRTRVASDAIRCAFELQEQLIAFFKEIKKQFFELPVEKIKRSKGGYDLKERSLGLSIGISTGWCLFGEMSVGDVNGRMMVGHTVNIAHRLTEVAQPREVLTSQTTFDLVGKYLKKEFEFKDITSDIEMDGQLLVKRLKDYENRPIYKIIPVKSDNN